MYIKRWLQNNCTCKITKSLFKNLLKCINVKYSCCIPVLQLLYICSKAVAWLLNSCSKADAEKLQGCWIYSSCIAAAKVLHWSHAAAVSLLYSCCIYSSYTSVSAAGCIAVIQQIYISPILRTGRNISYRKFTLLISTNRSCSVKTAKCWVVEKIFLRMKHVSLILVYLKNINQCNIAMHFNRNKLEIKEEIITDN